MNDGLWKRLLKSMKNDELAKLAMMIQEEQVRRANKRIGEGRYSQLNDEEESQIARGNPDEAIDMYMERTKCPVAMAEAVITYHESRMNYPSQDLRDGSFPG